MAKRAAPEEQPIDDARILKKSKGDRQPRIAKALYEHMCLAVDAAMRPGSLQPIILCVQDCYNDNTTHEYNYELAWYPNDRESALCLLQTLHRTAGSPLHTKLIQAVHHVDERGIEDSEDEDVKTHAQSCAVELEKLCGTTLLGRFERDFEYTDLSPFLFWAMCYIYEEKKDDEESSS